MILNAFTNDIKRKPAAALLAIIITAISLVTTFLIAILYVTDRDIERWLPEHQRLYRIESQFNLPNGDTGSHYGSLMKTDLAELLACSAHNQVAKREEQEAFNKMRQCRWFSLCHGGCPHDRVINRRHVAGYQDNCCGTGKLLATIEGCLNKESQATPKTEDNPHSPSGIA